MSDNKVNSSLSGKLEKTQINIVQKIPDITAATIGESSAPGGASMVFYPYRFNGKTYTAETELLRAMLEQPDEGLKDLERWFLSHHYYAFSEKKGALCADAEKKLGMDQGSNTRILCSLIYSLCAEVREICFNSRLHGNIQNLGRAFIDEGINEALQNHGLRGNSYPLTSKVKEFVISGIPEDYAAKVLMNTAAAEIFSKTAALWKNNDHAESDTELALTLGYSLCDDRRILVGGKIYESPEVFRNEMAALASKDRKAYLKLAEDAKADLDFLEKIMPDAELREAITLSFDDLKFAVFGDNEYHFANGQEFRSFIEQLVSQEKPYELRSLLNRYKIPLEQVSEKVWNTDSLGDLQKTVAGFIRIGEYLFTGEQAFRDFITGVTERQGRADPAYLLSFVKAHRDSLDSAAKAFPGIREAVASLYAANDAVILFDEELFPDLSSFKAFITDTINRGNSDPGYLLEFVKRHRNTIDSLMKNEENKIILKPLIDITESYIIFDSRIFTAVAAFESYLNEVIAAGKDDPGFLCRFIQDHDRVFADLRRDSRCEQILKNLYDARNQLVCFDEFVFRSVAEFREYMEQNLNSGKGNPAYLRRFVKEHEKTLTALNSVTELSPVVTPVLAAGNSVIELDEHVFNDAAGFVEFAGELTAEEHEKPLKGADFVREHKSGLEALKGTDALVSAVKELQELENAKEKGECITVNGTRYSPVPVKKGEYFKFGRYPQQNRNTKEPIEWLVLEANDKEALLISRYGLDCKKYHSEGMFIWGNITWRDCDLRKWLNHDFLKEAFSEEEQKRIKLSDEVNDNNQEYGTSGGNNTQDLIFCLSLAEAERFFNNKDARMCRPTDYAIAKGAHADKNNGCCYWWLRSPGKKQNFASYVDADGSIWPPGAKADEADGSVRPCLRLYWNM